MDLLKSLYKYAAGSRAAEEDPITDTLAYFLSREDLVLNGFLKTLAERFHIRELNDRNLGYPSVETQVTVPAFEGGICRYDLVMSWKCAENDKHYTLKVVIEVKVKSGLTWKLIDEDKKEYRDQISRYLKIAENEKNDRTYILLLSRDNIKIAEHDNYLGWLPWQEVHDLLIEIVSSFPDGNAGLSNLINEYVDILEEKRVATPKLTYDSITSVHRYMKFKKAMDSILSHAKDELELDNTLDGFEKITGKFWQEDHERAGWRLFVSRDRSHFAFMGYYYGKDTIYEMVPDLYFFLETRGGSEAQEYIDEKGTEIVNNIKVLNQEREGVEWGYDPGGWESVWAVKSTADIVGVNAERDATQFYRMCVERLKKMGILTIFFSAVDK